VTDHGMDRTTIEDSPVLTSLAAAYRAVRADQPAAARTALSQPVTGMPDLDDEGRLRVLTGRLRSRVPATPRRSSGTVAGLTPRYAGQDPGVADLAAQVEERIEGRLGELARTVSAQPWADGLPADVAVQIAIYRDLYDVRSDTSALGPPPSEHDTRQHAHFAALTEQLRTPSHATTTSPSATPAPTVPPATTPRPPQPRRP